MQKETPETAQRRERLARPHAHQGINASYSRFVRWMRIALPLAALAIVAVLFTWSGMQNPIDIPTPREAKIQPTVGKNELLNPRFESVDEKNQPYTIIAKRAVQGESNDDLLLLVEPVGDMLLESGNKIEAEALEGAYRQDTNRLVLQGSVKLRHDDGYELQTEKLQLDLAENLAWSEDAVFVSGPEGTLEAKGLQANGKEGLLVFTGPAKLILTQGQGGLFLSP